MKNYTVRITREALADINSIGDYIATQLEEPATALKVLERLYKKCERLSVFPKSSPVREKIKGVSLRFAHCGNYTIVYCVNKDDVEIRAVIYSRRNFLKN